MAVKLIMGFPLSLLRQESDYILDAGEAFAVDIDPELPAGYVADMRALRVTLRGDASTQKFKIADVGGLTIAQKKALKEVNRLVSSAKACAKRAFKGQTVKWGSEFQIGIHSPNDLASIISRAETVRDACAKAENAPLLAAKGWPAAATTALTNAIATLDTTGDTQVDTKVDKKGATDTRNAAANELYDGMLTIQTAANLKWPDNGNGNTPIRAKFRIGIFPPKQKRKKTSPPAPPAPPA